MMLAIVVVLGVFWLTWVIMREDPNHNNTLVVEKDTGRVVAITHIAWLGSQRDRLDSMVEAEKKYSPTEFEFVELNESTISQYDVFLTNRD